MTDPTRPGDVPAFDREQLRCPLCGSPHFHWERIAPFRSGVSSAFWGVLSETLELDMASCTACRHVLWFRA